MYSPPFPANDKFPQTHIVGLGYPKAASLLGQRMRKSKNELKNALIPSLRAACGAAIQQK
jgi:hypothetical protein